MISSRERLDRTVPHGAELIMTDPLKRATIWRSIPAARPTRTSPIGRLVDDDSGTQLAAPKPELPRWLFARYQVVVARAYSMGSAASDSNRLRSSSAACFALWMRAVSSW